MNPRVFIFSQHLFPFSRRRFFICHILSVFAVVNTVFSVLSAKKLNKAWGPFLEDPETFSYPESRSKISDLIVGYKTFFFFVYLLSFFFFLPLARASLVKNYAIYIAVILWSAPCARSKILEVKVLV